MRDFASVMPSLHGRIDELLEGRIEKIDELELEPEARGFRETRYRMLATGGWFI